MIAQQGDELPMIELPVMQLWTQRECARVLAVNRERVTEAVRTGKLPAEPSVCLGRSRRVLAADAVRVLAPHWMSRVKFV